MHLGVGGDRRQAAAYRQFEAGTWRHHAFLYRYQVGVRPRAQRQCHLVEGHVKGRRVVYAQYGCALGAPQTPAQLRGGLVCTARQMTGAKKYFGADTKSKLQVVSLRCLLVELGRVDVRGDFQGIEPEK